MDVFTRAASQMIILFIMIALGVIARKIGLMDERFSTMLSQIVMKITLPAMILSSVLDSASLPAPGKIGSILVLSLVSYVLVCVFSFVVVQVFYRRFDKPERGTHAFIIAFGNVGFMGFPVLGALYGDTAVLYAAIYNIIFNVAVFTYGIVVLRMGSATEKRVPLRTRLVGLGQSIVNPTMVVSVIAIVLALLGVTDNGGIVGTTCSYVGQMTVPASMLVIGCSLAQMSPRSLLNRVAPYVSSLFRLVIVPLGMFLLFRPFVDDPLMLGVIVIASGMPVASLGAMLSMVYGGDVKTMLSGTFISTVLSLLTIPLLALLLA